MENEMGLLEQQSKDLKNFFHKSNENIRGGGKKPVKMNFSRTLRIN